MSAYTDETSKAALRRAASLAKCSPRQVSRLQTKVSMHSRRPSSVRSSSVANRHEAQASPCRLGHHSNQESTQIAWRDDGLGPGAELRCLGARHRRRWFRRRDRRGGFAPGGGRPAGPVHPAQRRNCWRQCLPQYRHPREFVQISSYFLIPTICLNPTAWRGGSRSWNATRTLTLRCLSWAPS